MDKFEFLDLVEPDREGGGRRPYPDMWFLYVLVGAFIGYWFL